MVDLAVAVRLASVLQSRTAAQKMLTAAAINALPDFAWRWGLLRRGLLRRDLHAAPQVRPATALQIVAARSAIRAVMRSTVASCSLLVVYRVSCVTEARIVAAQYAVPTKRARIAARHWQTAQRLTQSPVRDRLVKSARTATIAVREFALPHPTASAGARPRRVVGQVATCALKTATAVQTHASRILRGSTAAPYLPRACQKASCAMRIASVAPTKALPSALKIRQALRQSAASSMAPLSSVYRMPLPVH